MPKQWSAPPAMQIDPSKRYVATLKTTKGDVKIELFASESRSSPDRAVNSLW